MKSKIKNKAAHVTSGSVLDDIGFPREKALALKFKARILGAILEEARTNKYGQKQLVELLDEHQPVVSNLLRGKVSQMSIEKLLTYANRMGLELEVRRTRQASRRRS